MENKRRFTKHLTKSKIKSNDDCATQLYLSEYHPELRESHSAQTLKTFDQGREVESLARALFLEEYGQFKQLISKWQDHKVAIREVLKALPSSETKALEILNKVQVSDNNSQIASEVMSLLNEVGIITNEMKNKVRQSSTDKMLQSDKKVIYEATFKSKVNHIQVDILAKNEDSNDYDAIEIKSNGKADEHILDVTIQYWTMVRKNRVRLRKIYVWCINTKAKDLVGFEDYFQKIDMTEIARKNKHLFIQKERMARQTQKSLEKPAPVLSSKCNDCPFFKKGCGKETIDNPKSVINLPNLRSKWDLFNQGIKEVDHPKFAETKFAKNNPHIVNAIKTGSRFMNVDGIKESLAQWQFPLRFMDFEAFMTAFPVFKGQMPYQQMVVQFSSHTLHKVGSEIEHFEWLHDKKTEPLDDSISNLLEAMGTSGSIVSYNAPYEKTRIKEMATRLEKLATQCEELKIKEVSRVQELDIYIQKLNSLKEALTSLIPRFVDLMDVIKDNIYDPKFMGSYSLKKTSPALLSYEKGGYTDSLLKSGSEFADYYLEFLTTEDEVRKQFLKQELLKYCKYDTLNLYQIYIWLLDQIKQHEMKAVSNV